MLPHPPSCNDCPASQKGIGYVPSRGPSSASIAVIGQGPGEDEARVGRPFVGKSGGLLSLWVKKAGLVERDLHIDNVVRCQLVVRNKAGDIVLGGTGKPQNRTPTAAEMRYCWEVHGKPRLLEVLGKAENPVALACGVPAMTMLLGRKGNANLAGNVFEVEI